ncbi:hypothetical protein [Streptomyces sp. NPDC006739]|uniref:hypothetical protein n=1 Tax=Streptomyces sp. NPDC006739 TaxID=3364763 RepID=UPI00367A84D1
MSDALTAWARTHARSIGREGPAVAASVAGAVVGGGGTLGVRDRTPDELRPYARLCLTAPADGPVVGTARGVAPPLTGAGLRPRVFALPPGGAGGRLGWVPMDDVPLEAEEWPIGWAATPTGDPLLVTRTGGNELLLHRVGGDPRRKSYSPGISLELATLARGPDGTALLTASGAGDVLVWDLTGGQLVDRVHVPFVVDTVSSVERGQIQPDGAGLIATGHRDGHVRVWDFDETGQGLRHEIQTALGPVWAMSWAMLPDGSALLASGHDDGRVCVWDGLRGQRLLICPPCPGRVDSVAWAVAPNGARVLASGHSDGTVRIWGWLTGAVLHEFDDLTARGPAQCDVGTKVDWLFLPDGAVWLYAAGETGARVWELDGLLGTAGRIPDGTGPSASPVPHLPWAVRRGLVRLAVHGVCPSLGLLHDLVALTGPTTAVPLLDERLRGLVDHPGLRLLRELAWPVRSRVGLAGLLAAGLSEPNTVPSPGHGPLELAEALRRALIGEFSRVPDGELPLEELRSAADAVTGRTAALLAVIGAEAVADDPVLPLRLAQQAAAMPAVDLRRLQILTGAVSTKARHAGTLTHAPGSGGISRTGRITQILPSQLALPAHWLTLRHARRELLYRLHSSAATWVPEPVTLVLDTSPPTFGPPEVVLRSLAHLLATSLWSHSRHAAFVGLDRPDLLRPVSRPADLAMLWTSRTLEPPDLEAALRTAASTGTPTVLLALHHLVRDHALVGGPRLRLATTHIGDDPPRGRPAETHHVHLPPDADGRRFADAVRLLLTGDGPS